MSIATLLPTDQGRSGCTFGYLQAQLSSNGEHFHPFLWHDNYWRPESLPEDLENETVAACNHYVNTITLYLTKTHDELLAAFENYYKLLTQCSEVVKANPPQDYAEVYEAQVGRCRIECLYNMALLWMIQGLERHAHFSNGVEMLKQAAGIFDAALRAPFRPESERIEVSQSNLRAMAALCMGCAYELSFMFYFKDTFFGIKENATLAHRASFYFTAATAIAGETLAITERHAFQNLVNIKRHFYEGCSLYVMSLETDTNKGESRRRRAAASFEAALQHVLRFLPGERPSVEGEVQWMLERCNNYRRLLRRAMIPEASLSSMPKRAPMYAANYPRDIKAELPPRIAELLNSESAEAEKKEEDAAAELPVKITTVVENVDLRTKPNPVLPGDTSVRYHYVDASLQLGTKDTEPDPLANVAVVYVVDITHPSESIRTSLKDLVGLSVRAGRLDAKDKIGLVAFDSDGIGTVSLQVANEENINKLATAVTKLQGRGRFRGSKGTTLVSGVKAARAALLDEACTNTVKEIVVVSDGWDNTAHSDKANWALIQSLRDDLSASPAALPINTFAMSGAADHQLLKALANRTGGNYATLKCNDDDGEEAISALRRWLVTCLNTMKVHVAGTPSATITCAKGVLIAAVGQTTHVAPDPAKLGASPTQTTIHFPSMSAGNFSNAVVTFAVPADVCRQDVAQLATVDFEYTTNWGEVIKSRSSLYNESWRRLADRDIHNWLHQLAVDQRKGRVMIFSPGDKVFPSRGGETVCSRDSVETSRSGTVALTTVEGTKIELDNDTYAKFDSVEKGSINMQVQKGKLNIITVRDNTVVCQVDKYTVTVEGDTSVRLAFVDGVFKASCVLGSVLIVTAGAESDKAQLRLNSPKQTSARSPAPPVTPWAITDDVFQEWMEMNNSTTERLRDIIAVQTQVCRLRISSAVSRISRYLLRALRTGTLNQTKAAKRCRVFYVNHLLNEAKQFVLNSIAYSTANPVLDAVRRELEAALVIAAPNHRWELNLADVNQVMDSASALASGRNRGHCTLYELPSYHIQV